MGREEIIGKLKTEISKKIINECQVVFILSRIRKILEIKNEKRKYKHINFYCNWVLHSKLDRRNTTDLLKDLFEKHIDSETTAKEIASILKNNQSNFFKLITIKEELINFFENYNLSVDNIINNWKSFEKLLLGLIKECPVIFTSNKLKQLELTKDKNNNYCYKFTLSNYSTKPIIKLKYK